MKVNADLELLQAYLDDSLSADEVGAVEARLKAEPDLARLLVRLAREEAVLSEWARAARATASEPSPTRRRRRPAAAGAADGAHHAARRGHRRGDAIQLLQRRRPDPDRPGGGPPARHAPQRRPLRGAGQRQLPRRLPA